VTDRNIGHRAGRAGNQVRLKYRFKIPSGMREKAERALTSYADKCPAYQTVKGCIECSWNAEMEEV